MEFVCCDVKLRGAGRIVRGEGWGEWCGVSGFSVDGEGAEGSEEGLWRGGTVDVTAGKNVRCGASGVID